MPAGTESVAVNSGAPDVNINWKHSWYKVASKCNMKRKDSKDGCVLIACHLAIASKHQV